MKYFMYNRLAKDSIKNRVDKTNLLLRKWGEMMSVVITHEELENMVEKGVLKKEYKDTEVYIKSQDGTIEKTIKKCWVYETVI